jgi:transposase
MDLFVAALPLSDYGFKMDFIDNGRPAYQPADLLKLFIYGYLNRIRSSRQCKRNLELIWLMPGCSSQPTKARNFSKHSKVLKRTRF